MLCTNYNKRIVKEAYYGKSKHLEECVKQLEIITKKIRDTKTVVDIIKLRLSDSKENLKLQELLCKEFGFGQVSIFWDSSLVPNAFTISGGLFIDTTPGERMDRKERQANRYYDKEHRFHATIVVMMNLVKKLSLTAKETLAIILHEIGHNFDTCFMTTVSKSIGFVLSTGLVEIIRPIYKKFVIPSMDVIQKEFPWVKKLFDLRNDLRYELDALPGDPIKTFQSLTPLNIMMGLFGYQGEKFSDKFAASYGFGSDLSSALNKMDDPTKVKGVVKSTIYTIPVLRTLYDLADSSAAYIRNMVDPHPEIDNRMSTIIIKLEKDLADPNVPSSLKKEISREIELNKKIYKSNINMDDQQWAIAKRFFKSTNDQTTRYNGVGSDLRDFFDIGSDGI